MADLPFVCTICVSDAQLFKTAFESAQAANASLVSGTDAPSASAIPQDPEATSAKETEPAAPKAEEATAAAPSSAPEVHGDKVRPTPLPALLSSTYSNR